MVRGGQVGCYGRAVGGGLGDAVCDLQPAADRL